MIVRFLIDDVAAWMVHLLVSSAVVDHVALPEKLKVSTGESIALRGRQQPLEIHQVHQG